MQLAVGKFYNYRPAAQWAFDVQFSDMYLTSSTKYVYTATNSFSDEELRRISQSVVSVSMPKYTITDDTKCYGNFNFVVPIYDANNCMLEITFEDTDDCLISYKFVSALMGTLPNSKKNIPAWLNVHSGVYITINRYNPYDSDRLKTKSIFNNGVMSIPNNNSIMNGVDGASTITTYFCKMIEYTEPNYSRTTDTPSATTVTIKFLIVPTTIRLNDNSIVAFTEPETLTTANIDEIIQELSKLKVNAVRLAENAYGIVVNAIGTGYMAKTFVPNLRKLQEDAASKGYDVSTLRGAANYISQFGMSSKFLGQCTRGTSLVLQLLSYARGDAGISENYVNSCKAHEFGKGNNSNISQAVKNMYNESIEESSVVGNTLFSNKIAKNLHNEGDYVIFKYKNLTTNEEKSHIVFMGYGKKWYSDAAQTTAAGINDHNGKDTIVFYDIKYYTAKSNT